MCSESGLKYFKLTAFRKQLKDVIRQINEKTEEPEQ